MNYKRSKKVSAFFALLFGFAFFMIAPGLNPAFAQEPQVSGGVQQSSSGGASCTDNNGGGSRVVYGNHWQGSVRTDVSSGYTGTGYVYYQNGSSSCGCSSCGCSSCGGYASRVSYSNGYGGYGYRDRHFRTVPW
jgi:hypothetical protein